MTSERIVSAIWVGVTMRVSEFVNEIVADGRIVANCAEVNLSIALRAMEAQG